MDIAFYEEENKLLRGLVKHWQAMYENMRIQYEDAMKENDRLVTEKLEKEVNNG